MSSKEIGSENLEIQDFDGVYKNVKNRLEEARARVYSTVNFYMVKAYWEIGREIYKAQEENERAKYGEKLIKNLSKQLTEEFGKGFTTTNLKTMRKFYLVFPNSHSLRDQLSWTHYRLLIKIENERKRDFYIKECIESNWSTRQLERQINSFYYERLLSTQEDNIQEFLLEFGKGFAFVGRQRRITADGE